MQSSKIEVKGPYINGVRKLIYNDKDYYLKIGDPSDIHKEVMSYSIARCFLQDVIDIDVPEVISLDLSHQAILLKDYGDTLEKQIRNGHRAKVSFYRLRHLLIQMAERGILWGEFLPHNLFLNKHDRFRGINFEDFYCFGYPLKQISSLIVMKWSFGWEEFLDGDNRAPEIYDLISDYFAQKDIIISDEVKHSESLQRAD
jgi:hypothetical protein